MEKKKVNKKSILKRITLGLVACLIAVCSIIAFIPSNKIDTVSADTVDSSYVYSSSTLYIPIRRYGYDYIGVDERLDLLNWDISLTSTNSGVLVDISIVTAYAFVDTTIWQDISFNFINVYSFYFDEERTVQTLEVPFITVAYRPIYCYFLGNLVKYQLLFSVSENFNCNIVSVELGHDIHSSNQYFNYVRYTDVNGGTFTVSFFVNDLIIEEDLLSYRIYYLDNPANFSDSESYNYGYKAGYTDGYRNGDSTGKANGYASGYNTGLTEGYNSGYNVGVSDSNQYSFYNLFGAVLDAPVKVFSGLFNFELLGINLLGLITGLFTLAVIIIIIKKVMGGK